VSAHITVCETYRWVLTVKQPDWYINFSMRFVENVLFEQRNIKL